jgi:hypothetical protein
MYTTQINNVFRFVAWEFVGLKVQFILDERSAVSSSASLSQQSLI